MKDDSSELFKKFSGGEETMEAKELALALNCWLQRGIITRTSVIHHLTKEFFWWVVSRIKGLKLCLHYFCEHRSYLDKNRQEGVMS